MIAALITLSCLLMLSVIALYSSLTKRITASLRAGDLKEVEQKTASEKQSMAKEYDKQIQEVKNATPEQLLARVRLRVLRGGNSSTTSSK